MSYHADFSHRVVHCAQVTFRVLEDRRAVMIAHKSARGSLKVQNGGRRAIEVLAVPLTQPLVPHSSACSASALSAPSSRQSSQSSTLAAEASMQVRSQPESSRPSSRDLSPVMRNLSVSQHSFGINPHPAPPATTSFAAPAAPPTQANAPTVVTPACSPVDLPLNSKRVRGSVIRILKKSKRLPPGITLGVLRSASNENWAKAKQAITTPDTHPMAGILKDKGLGLHALPGDILFWSTDVRSAEHRDVLQKNDEVEYSVVLRPLEEGDAHAVSMAIDIALVRAVRPAQTGSAAKWQPPTGPFAAAPRSVPGAMRKAPKFSGSSTVVVPGPEKGVTGFQAGRGRPLDEPKKRIHSFRFEDVVSASAFVPKSGAADSAQGTVDERAPLATMLTVHPFAGQFDDPEV
jgi:hypothetical protein